MDTGNIAYRKTLGVSDMLPPGMQDTGRASSGGVILTASGLTFVGGTDDFRTTSTTVYDGSAGLTNAPGAVTESTMASNTGTAAGSPARCRSSSVCRHSTW